jgi:hypothetical protein
VLVVGSEQGSGYSQTYGSRLTRQTTTIHTSFDVERAQRVGGYERLLYVLD